MRIDEFSRNESRESHAAIPELTSQIQDLQEKMNYMNGRFAVEKDPTFPVNWQLFQVFVGC